MKRNRIFQEIVLFVIIVFAFTTVNFFAIQESSAHQLCSGCPTEDSGETYCYDCNSEHNHLEEAKNALDSAISNAQSIVTSLDSLKYEVENSNYSGDIVSSIASGLGDAALSLTGAVAAALATKATLASAGTLAPAGYWAAGYALGVSANRASSSLNHFSDAWSTYKYHNAEVICPEPLCGQPTTQAALDGMSADRYHAFKICPYEADYNGSRIHCGVEYRNCRGVCPNAINHYDTGN